MFKYRNLIDIIFMQEESSSFTSWTYVLPIHGLQTQLSVSRNLILLSRPKIQSDSSRLSPNCTMGIYGRDDFYASTRSHLLYKPIKGFSALVACVSIPKHDESQSVGKKLPNCDQLNPFMSHDLRKQWLQQYNDIVTFWEVTNSNDNSLHCSVVPEGSPATIKMVL